MERIKQFLQNDRGRLEKINVYKVYYRHLMDYPEVTITIKNYIDEMSNDYEFLFDKLVEIDIEPSIVPVDTWVERKSQVWGWDDITF